jgi:transposase
MPITKYPAELKERAVRLVFEARKADPGDRQVISRIARQLGIKSPETLRSWVSQTEIDEGVRPGVTTADAEYTKKLERENFELRRANEILRRASAFFAAELDRPQK